MASPSTRAHTRQPSIVAAIQTPAPPATPDSAPLPPPQTFDFLPPLHALLSRLLLPSGGLKAPASAPGENATTATGTNPLSSPPAPAEISHDEHAIDGTGHLDIQELAAASGAIKIRIQKARTAVKELPDVDRSIKEQEQEIAELEARIGKMREMLKGLSREGD
jgi:hypothetical protein